MAKVSSQVSSQAERILDEAIAQAEKDNWEIVHLHQVADSLGLSLDEIKQFYPQKDDLVEAWFDRADSTVLANKVSSGFTELSSKERLHHVIMQWLLSMSEHRRVTRQMLYYKFEFGHVHLQVLGILRISRTVQWFREAALLKTTNLSRILEELCITGIFLNSFARWLFDDSEQSKKTSDYLQRALKHVHSLN